MSKFLTLGNRVVNTDQITFINLDGLDADRKPCIVVNFPGGDFIRIEKKSPAADTLRAWLEVDSKPVVDVTTPRTDVHKLPIMEIDASFEKTTDGIADVWGGWLGYALKEQACLNFTEWLEAEYTASEIAHLFRNIYAHKQVNHA